MWSRKSSNNTNMDGTLKYGRKQEYICNSENPEIKRIEIGRYPEFYPFANFIHFNLLTAESRKAIDNIFSELAINEENFFELRLPQTNPSIKTISFTDSKQNILKELLCKLHDDGHISESVYAEMSNLLGFAIPEKSNVQKKLRSKMSANACAQLFEQAEAPFSLPAEIGFNIGLFAVSNLSSLMRICKQTNVAGENAKVKIFLNSDPALTTNLNNYVFKK